MNTYKIRYSVRSKLFTDTIKSRCLATAINKLELKAPNHKILDIETNDDDPESKAIWAAVGFIVCAFIAFCVLADKGVLL
jgi:hypothetical protein